MGKIGSQTHFAPNFVLFTSSARVCAFHHMDKTSDSDCKPGLNAVLFFFCASILSRYFSFGQMEFVGSGTGNGVGESNI